MHVTRFGALALGFATLLASIAFIGCADKPDTPKPDSGATTDGKTTPAKEATALKPGKGTFKGMVKLTGDKPNTDKLTKDLVEQMTKKTDSDPTMKAPCLTDAPDAEKMQQDWKIGDSGGVADVYVYFKPVTGTFFAFEESDDAIKAAKAHNPELTQPHCAFIPHAISVFPTYRDSKNKKKETGQKLIVTNTAKVAHNTKIESWNETVPVDGKKEAIIPSPSYTPTLISCAVHPWMNANLLVLEHPYVAVTNEKGEFEMKNVPVGKVQVLVWHSNADNPKAVEIELKEGSNEKDFEVKAKK